jgi:hypothetical protein
LIECVTYGGWAFQSVRGDKVDEPEIVWAAARRRVARVMDQHVAPADRAVEAGGGSQVQAPIQPAHWV